MISIIIVNHNGFSFIKQCLESVMDSNYKDFEIIVVDNGSKDGSLDYLEKEYRKNISFTKLIINPVGLGPAVARNQGIRYAKGEYVVFLDNDTKVDKNWLNGFMYVFSNRNVGIASAKLLRMGSCKIDSVGDYITPFGFLKDRAEGAIDDGQFDFPAEILSGKTACTMIRKQVLDRIGGFDEDYFMYLEDTDLYWRVWLSGYHAMLAPYAEVYHAYGTIYKPLDYYDMHIVRYYGCRNYILTIIKNLEFKTLAVMLPLQIISFIGVSLMFLTRLKVNDFLWIWQGILWNLFHVISVARKRSQTQKLRKVKDDCFLYDLMVCESPHYHYNKARKYTK